MQILHKFEQIYIFSPWGVTLKLYAVAPGHGPLAVWKWNDPATPVMSNHERPEVGSQKGVHWQKTKF